MKDQQDNPSTASDAPEEETETQLAKIAVGQRLKLARENLNMSQKEFCAVTGMAFPSLRGYEVGLRMPGGDAIAVFIRAGINANWLLTGEGSILLRDSYKHIIQQYPGRVHKPYTVEEVASNYVAVKPYDAYESQQPPSDEAPPLPTAKTPEDALIFREDWIRIELGSDPSNLSLIRISSDAMEPVLRVGDMVLVDRSTPHQPNREGIYLLQVGGMLMVRRLQSLPGGLVNVWSDNPALVAWQLKQTDFQGPEVILLGRVIWTGRRI